MICAVCNKVVFVKYCPDFKGFFREVIKDQFRSRVTKPSGGFNLVLRNTAMIVREVPFARRSFLQKYSPDFDVFWGNYDNIPHRSRFQ